MCGIWASIGVPAALGALDAVAHRGPDGQGMLTMETPAGLLVLGHRRLSIYDPTPAGAQPMRTPDGGAIVAFNGAIYNFKSLRKELEARGFRFFSRSDTEVLLAAYRAWGEACVERFNGMFAFALLDTRAGKLVIARDRFGEKPLHVARYGGGIAFASEPRQLLAAAPELARFDQRIAGEFLNFGVVDDGVQTFFAPIRRFPAAHIASLDLSRPIYGADIAPRRYWAPPAPEGALADPAAAAEQLKPALRRAVALRLEADAPVGTCLSGGLDSTYIARTAEALRPTAAPHFISVSAIFDEDDLQGRSLSERPFVEMALSGGRFQPRFVTPGDEEAAEAFDAVVAAQGEPFASASICAQWFVFREANRAGAKVMLDGQGADELFGGYSGMIGHRLADLLTRDLAGERAPADRPAAPALAAQAAAGAGCGAPPAARGGARRASRCVHPAIGAARLAAGASALRGPQLDGARCRGAPAFS
jgi:asparagine synthase (glutamine-hydrolysing)